MVKKYIVRLNDEDRSSLQDIVKKLNGRYQKVRRAQILLKTDADGPNWKDEKIAEAFSCRTRTIQNIRKQFVLEGLDAAMNRKKRITPPTPNKFNGKQEAQIIAMRLSPPPKGFANWTLRLLASKVVELEITDSVSPETLRKVLKKII